MNAPSAIPPDTASPSDLSTEIAASAAVYAERCEARAMLHVGGKISLHEAVDELQAYAEDCGLVDHIGQDEAQRIMGKTFAAVDMLQLDTEGEACEREIFLRTAEQV